MERVFVEPFEGYIRLMNMPERSFGRTVRYRRTQLGMSQAKLAELVGRATPTIRAWERDRSRPNDPKVLSALAAILGIDERHLFDKAEVEPPGIETSPTVEQALATLSGHDIATAQTAEPDDGQTEERTATELPGQQEPDPETSFEYQSFDFDGQVFEDQVEEEEPEEEVVEADSDTPAYAAPPDPYNRTPLTPTLADVSYIEDDSQRQLYRVRTLATLVALVALVIAFIWAIGEGLGALGAWWDEFFGNLRI